jgi:PKD repeat protein
MRTDAAPLGWGWTTRAGVGLIGLLLAVSSTAPTLRAQSGTYGEWRTLASLMPINPVHTALMHDGRVLIVSGSGNVAAETNFRSAVLDLQADRLDVTYSQPWDMFCNGMVVLADGRVFVNGGNLAYDPFHGQPKNAAFDPATGVFTDLQNMAHGRWYPTVTTLGDGSVMTFSGLDENGSTNSTVEIYTPGSGWSQQYSAGWTPPLYPRMHLLPNGNVLYSGSGTGSRIFNTTNKTWSAVVATTNYSGTRGYGTSVLLPLRPSNGYKGRVMIFGGGNPATATTEILDTSAPTLQWQNGPAMSQGRIEMNATILPNGKILATGGSTKDEDATTKSLNADLYDPVSNTFSSAGQNVYARLYHSNALLLPDATVLLLGGNPARGTYEQHMEIYSPAYLFNGDGTAAVRPAINSVSNSEIAYGGAFDIQTPDAANITSVVLVRPGAPTHAFDMEQRLVELTFTTGTGVLTATAPPNGNIAPPGYYMMFVLNSSGVPSVATWVHLTSAPPPPPNQPPSASIDNPTSSVTINPGDTVAFSGSGTDPDGVVASYAWTFPGGSPASSTAPAPGNVTYATPGSYTATFKVTDNGGLSSTTQTRTITVSAPPNQAPTASIDIPASNVTVNPGGVVGFSGSGSDPDGVINSYAWTFPGGSPASSSVASPGNVTYSTPGSYTATFKVTDNLGLASATQNRTITVTDFSLSATPGSNSVAQGTSADYIATVTGGPGFTGNVTFSVTGLPAGASPSFSPASLMASGSPLRPRRRRARTR